MKYSATLLYSAAFAAMVALSPAANADMHTITHHEFVNYQTSDLGMMERLDLHRYLNYEFREPCQNYREPPMPFYRMGCDLLRGTPVKMDHTIYFDTASAAIRGGEYGKIREIVDAIAATNARSVEIVGHTDTQGGDEYNQKLSMRRADAVAKALNAKGISTRIIDEEAEGERDLAVDTADGVANQSNRRVTVHIIR